MGRMAGVAGLEPTNDGVKVRCLHRLGYTPFSNPKKIGEPTGIRTPDTRLRRPLLYPTELWTHMERMMRIELTLSAWKAEVLPLNYIRASYKIFKTGAEDEIRTRDPRLGKAMLYP